MGIWVCMLSESAHLHTPPLQYTIAYGTGFTAEYVFGQHLTEPIASHLPCSLVFKQTTIQGQIGPKPEENNPIHSFEHPGGSMFLDNNFFNLDPNAGVIIFNYLKK